MQLQDDVIRPVLEDNLRACWNPVNLRPDAPRVAMDSSDLPDVRVQLLDGETQPTGGAAASRDVVIPHTYEITGRWAYPVSGTVNTSQIARLNEFLLVFTANYPRYAGWRYLESVVWAFEDNAEEETYSVAVTITLEVIAQAGN